MAHKEDDESLDEIQPSMSLALSEEGFDRIKSDVFRRLLNLELQIVQFSPSIFSSFVVQIK